MVRIVEDIKERLGSDYPVSVRINVRDGIPNGLEPPEAAELARIFQEAGADVINTSAGTYESGSLIFPPTMAPQGNLLANIQVVKQAVDIPVIAVGRIKTPELAERVIAESQADFVSLGRALLADPEWPNKVQQGKEAEILPCIGCNYGCIERIDQDLERNSVTCAATSTRTSGARSCWRRARSRPGNGACWWSGPAPPV